mmetsp:Transcript_11520/g.22083  ORF Transcript_11520/g.22083 Transcript_11520/m.22083 type:complete len:540 (-) Transcript_11520:121-1740(-)
MEATAGTKADEAAKATQSLGWLTESAMPRKREARSIEMADNNVSAVRLKAAMLQAQAEVKQHREDPTFYLRKQRVRGGDLFKEKNRGVDERNRHDLAMNQQESALSNEQLNAKAKVYEKMKRGQLNHANSLVDFEQKGFMQAEMKTATMEDEMERRKWEREAMQAIRTGVALTKRKERPINGVKQKYDNTMTAEEKEILSQVSAETVAARVRKESAADKRKAALLLRKQRLLAAKNRRKNAASLFKSGGASAAPELSKKSEPSLAAAPSSVPTSKRPDPQPSPETLPHADENVRRGRNGEILKAYKYRAPSPDKMPESRPNPHREYAAIAPPSSLTAQPPRKKQRSRFDSKPSQSQTHPSSSAESEARSFLSSLSGQQQAAAAPRQPHAGNSATPGMPFQPPYAGPQPPHGYAPHPYPYGYPAYPYPPHPYGYPYPYPPHFPHPGVAQAPPFAQHAPQPPNQQPHQQHQQQRNENQASQHSNQNVNFSQQTHTHGQPPGETVPPKSHPPAGGAGNSSSQPDGGAAAGIHPERARMLGLL